MRSLALRLLLPLLLLAFVSPACGAAPADSDGSPYESDANRARVRVSEYPDRRLWRALNGATLRGDAYVFYAGQNDVARVVFTVDGASGGRVSTETAAPFDLRGGTATVAVPFDTSALADGTHSLTVEVETRAGQRKRYDALFETLNGAADVVPADLYVATDGDDGASGAADQPLRTPQAAVDRARAGDVIYLRGGVYRLSDTLRINRSGSSHGPIRLLAYPGEVPILDGTELGSDKAVLRVRAAYWTIKGLELRNGPSYGAFLEEAHDNHFEDVASHGHGNPGFHLEHNASYNTFYAVDSFDNFDPGTGGGNADGFSVQRYTSIGNVFIACRAWNNSDDGFDMLESGPQRIDRSVAFRNGYRLDGTPYPRGDGNGFKLGIGEGRWRDGGGHTITRSVAWGNLAWGFTSNDGTIPIIALNNTAWRNGLQDFLFNHGPHVLVNNLSADNDVYTSPEVVSERNSWQLGITDPGFLSTDPDDPAFLHLAPDSPAVGAGREIGLEYAGRAPDLGAFEVAW